MRKAAVPAAGLALSASLAGLVYAAPASGAGATEKSAVAPTASAAVPRTAVDDHGRGRSRADDPAGHDAGDDRRVSVIPPAPAPKATVVTVPASSVPSVRRGADDPASHDAGDDRGSGGHGSDDPAGHDAGDDRGSGGHGSDD
jgi:hypothetical protein